MKKNSTIYLIFFLGVAILLYPHMAQLVNSQKQKGQVEDFLEDFRHIEISNEEVEVIMEKAKRCNEEIYDDSDRFRDPFGDNEGDINIFSVVRS
ncbi:hypothetical protein ACI2OX_15930 [Bacillus sp. N9]